MQKKRCLHRRAADIILRVVVLDPDENPNVRKSKKLLQESVEAEKLSCHPSQKSSQRCVQAYCDICQQPCGNNILQHLSGQAHGDGVEKNLTELCGVSKRIFGKFEFHRVLPQVLKEGDRVRPDRWGTKRSSVCGKATWVLGLP